MSESSKPNFQSILIQIGQVVAIAAVVTAAVLYIMRGEIREELQPIQMELVSNEVRDENHHRDEDLHMPYMAKRAEFVTRTEWENENETELEHFRRIEGQLDDFAREQRIVNREILQRLPDP